MSGASSVRTLRALGLVAFFGITALAASCASGGADTATTGGDEGPAAGGTPGATGGAHAGGSAGAGKGGASGASGGSGAGGSAGGGQGGNGTGGAGHAGNAGHAGSAAAGNGGSPLDGGTDASMGGSDAGPMNDGGVDGCPADMIGNSCVDPNKKGQCANGTFDCKNGSLTCVTTAQPTAETCNGKDDDCDGVIDNPPLADVGGNCDTGKVGVCKAGTLVCNSGTAVCQQNVQAMPEQCNGFDDDCDGVVDNGQPGAGQDCMVANQPPNSPCAKGKTTCTMGGQTQCVQTYMATSETCNGVDDDCNGVIDDPGSVNGLFCMTGLPGICAAGKTQCTGGNGQCIPDVLPSTVSEKCNGLDDDCNGLVDDLAGPAATKADCTKQNPSAQNVSTWSCLQGTCNIDTCGTNYADCDGAPANGCEVNVNADPTHCGGCAVQCSTNHDAPSCVNGQCAISCNTGFGDCDTDPSNGCEVNLQTTATHCGSCANVCGSQNAVPSCQSGGCVLVCQAGFGDCDNNPMNGCETNLNTTTQDCGKCGNVCSSLNGGASCNGGVCGIACNAGYADCTGTGTCQTNVNTDPTHCGGCAIACSTNHDTPTCSNGTCVLSCLQGYGDCDGDLTTGCETSFSNDVNHCGSCNLACSSVNGTPNCVNSACTINCSAGFGDCNANASDGCESTLATDTKNCGVCGHACSSKNGSPSCTAGVCSITCNPGFADCNSDPSDGCEADLTANVNNCGKCGSICSTNHDSPSCVSGACQVTCFPGFADCNNNPIDGCEVDLGNVQNCGSCGNACVIANGTPSCVSGKCAVGSCNVGYADCDGNPANGCETNLNTDPTHCGSCAGACFVANGAPACNNGTCGIQSCTAPYADCDNKYSNGCETNTSTTVTSCGACGTTCTTPNGTPACSGGSCVVASCNTGFANCDGMSGNGCETSTATDPANCGTCGKVCSYQNEAGLCVSGSCSPGGCNPGYSNCDATPGCETNTASDVNNCGVCGHVCNLPGGTNKCLGGVCTIATCTAPLADCDGNPANGCEVNTSNDPNNCNGCMLKCTIANGTAGCSNGMCTVASCNAGWADCDGNPANGCETNIAGDTSNCGACKNVCNLAHASASCSNGSCVVAMCSAGYTNCNGQATDGCEVNTAADPNHCGSCTTTCTVQNGTPGCTNGTCNVASCVAGYKDCDGVYSTGCETNIASDPKNCGACGTNCNTACGPNDATTACTSGVCSIATCTSGFADIDKTCSDGCECAQSQVGNQCQAPTNLGSMVIGGTQTVSDNLVTQTDVWLQVQFTGNTSTSYHPHVVFTSNPGLQFVFDIVQSNCSTAVTTSNFGGSASCTATTVTEFQTYYTGGDPSNPSNFYPIPAFDATNTVLIHVRRKAGLPVTCDKFTLSISN